MPRRLPRRSLRLEHLEDRATPASFTVTSLGDAGVGTGTSGDLRYCITAANDEVAFPDRDTITFAPDVAGGRVDLLFPEPLTQGTGALLVTSEIIIFGTGETINRNNPSVPFRLFNISNTGNLTLVSLTLTGGLSTVGGAISNDGELTIFNSTLIGNATKGDRGRFVTGFVNPIAPGHGEGGAIYNTGNMFVANTTIVGNRAEGGDQGVADAAGLAEGGGIFNDKGTARLINNTIARNVVVNGVGVSPGNPRGGALYNFTNLTGVEARVSLSNNILSDTNDGVAGDGVFSDVASEGGSGAGPAILETFGPNLVSVKEALFGGVVNGEEFDLGDPQLGPLQDNGNGFRTMVPGFSGPAINAGFDKDANEIGFNEVQVLTVLGASGTFQLTFENETTTALPVTATAADIQTALNALDSISLANGFVTVERVGLNFRVTFVGDLETTDVMELTATVEPTLGGPTVLISTRTQGLRYVTDQRGNPFPRFRFVSDDLLRSIDLGAIENQGPLGFSPTSLPNGTVGQSYSVVFSAFNPPGPYTFATSAGTLPPGLTLTPNGTLSGTPTTTGTFEFTVQASTTILPNPETAAIDYSVTIVPAPPPPPPPPPPPNGGGGNGGGGNGGGNGGGGTNPNSDDGGKGPGGRLILATGRTDGTVQVFDFDAVGGPIRRGGLFAPFSGFTGVVRAAAGDLNVDGVGDYVLGTGPGGGSLIRLVDGKTGSDLAPMFSVFEPSYTGGLYVAAADLDRDGQAEFAVTPDQGGGGRVVVFALTRSGIVTTPVIRANFFGIDDPNFRGGARVAMADITGDSIPDMVVGAGFGGGPRVSVYDGATLFGTPTRLVNDFFAFPGSDAVTLRNGVFVTAGDYNGDNRADLAFGGGPDGGPRVVILSGDLIRQGQVEQAVANPIANFFAFNENQRGGVRVATKEGDGDGFRELVVGSGDEQVPILGVYRGKSIAERAPRATVVDPFGDPILENGVYVG